MSPTDPSPPVTVVVCTKDRPVLLERCLSALARLEYPAYEVVVVDNGSLDDQARVLAERHGVRVVREGRIGLDNARNRGVAEARHELVAFTDDDVCAEPGWLSALAGALAEPGIDAVTGLVLPLELETRAQQLFESYGNGMSKGPNARTFRRAELATRALIAVQHVGVGANMAVRKAALRAIGGFDPNLDVGTPSAGAGDLDVFHRLLVAGKTIRYVPDAIVRHRHRRGMDELEAQLRANGRSYGVYLLKVFTRGTVPRHAVATYALFTWIPWLLGRLAIGFVGRHRLPVRLLWAEVRGAFTAPWAFMETRRAGRLVADEELPTQSG